MKVRLHIILITLISFTVSCQKHNKTFPSSNSPSEEFSQYWFQGKAELTSYDLEQARYGEIREGKAVMIFVTEDFSNTKQVKLDYPAKAKNDALKVLKLNLTKKFNTGVYPYSMMSSVFTPIDLSHFPNTLKTTASSQERCGHAFSQLNFKKGKYDYLLRSYFESEGDRNESLEGVFLEDEIWTRIRINPSSLPQGDFVMIPSGLYSRLSHLEMKAYQANASLTSGVLDDTAVSVYEVSYIDIDKSLKVYFENSSPYRILKWEETHKSGSGKSAKMMTTTATRSKSIMLDYWSKNHLADSVYREILGL